MLYFTNDDMLGPFVWSLHIFTGHKNMLNYKLTFKLLHVFALSLSKAKQNKKYRQILKKMGSKMLTVSLKIVSHRNVSSFFEKPAFNLYSSTLFHK